MKVKDPGGAGERGGIDWQALLGRQEATGLALAGGRTLNGEDEQALLKARAVRLACRPAEEDRGQRLDCLEFLLSGERYAMEMSYIVETLPLTDFTPLFCTPAFVLGIINVRGRIVSIIDLRRFFELPAVGLADLNRVIVVGNGDMTFGVLADAIVGMTEISPRDLQAPPATCTGIREEFLTGVTADRLAILDMGKVLADKRVIVHEEVA